MSFTPNPLGGPIGSQLMRYVNTGGHDPYHTPFHPHPLGGPLGSQVAENLNLFKPSVFKVEPPKPFTLPKLW